MKKVGFVVDSTFDLPLKFYEENGVTMVPLRTRFGEEEIYRDFYEIEPDEFYEKLRKSSVLPKTSQPPVQDFIDAYKKMEGKYDVVASMHINSKISGTYESARIASESVNIPVKLIESDYLTSAGMALALKLALKKQREGIDGDDLLAFIDKLCEKARVMGMVSTLDYLVKGGRIGKAQGLVGSLLDLKPIITLTDGVITPMGRARGLKKAMKMILDGLLNVTQGEGIRYIQFHYTDDRNLVESFKEVLKSEGIEYVDMGTDQVGSVIGTYLGFGVLMTAAVKI